ncbi:hypothetical protein [Sinorhizobium sp. M4_45]|uniref:hypothetical protein n=1 Tax=Sinorhizobium sp. M4_45 TaxID=2037901 RepID=UPI000C9B3F99|nr:hypothetical protein [Sinorhizobium sp. M4_45]PND29091.1 hypothetical protein CN933_03225 [Sinorhizobium sp. M4_45]
MQVRFLRKLAFIIAPAVLSIIVSVYLVHSTIRSSQLEEELKIARLSLEIDREHENVLRRMREFQARNPSEVMMVASGDDRVLLSVPTQLISQSLLLSGIPTMNGEGEDTALRQMRSLGETIQSLPDGKVALNAPTQMTVGEPREISAVVGVGVPTEELAEVFRKGDQHFSADAKVSHKMVARLTGANFKVEEYTTGQQLIALGNPTMWKWRVTASLEGTQTLTAMLYAVVTNGKDDVEVLIDTYDQEITVEVKPMTWMETFSAIKNSVKEAWEIWLAVGGLVSVVVVSTRSRLKKLFGWPERAPSSEPRPGQS